MSLQTVFDNFALLADAPNGVAKLRELILQLAVKGQLDTQSPNDQSATALLRKIVLHKERLIKDKQIRNSRPLPIIQSDEILFDIPQTWQWIRLGQIGDWGAGATPNRKRHEYYGGSFRWFKSGELNDGFIRESEETITDLALKECSLRLNQPGDVLIAMYGATIGKLAILETEATTNQAVCACTCFDGFYNQFLFVLLRAYKSHFTGRGAGGAQPNISREKIIHTVAPLPPLEEQKRIVARVDELMRLCDELEARQQARRQSRVRINNATLAPLNNAASLAPGEFEQAAVRLADNFAALCDSAETIGKLRSTILQLAVQGKLVPQELNDEPTSVLLAKIANEKQELVKQNTIRSFPEIAVDSNLKRLIPIPKNWKWSTVLDVALLVTDGEHATPPRVDKPGIPLATAKNVRNELLDLTITDYVSTETAEKCWRRCRPDHNDLLIVCVGATTGRLTLVKNPPPMVIVRSVALIRPFPKYISPEFIALSMKSPLGQSQVWDKVKQSAQPCLYINRLQSICLPIPPLSEQKRIVAKVNQLMALCDVLESKLRQAEADSEKLMNAAVRHVLTAINDRSTRFLAGASV